MRDDPTLRRAEAFVRDHAPGEDAWRLLEPAFRDLEAGLSGDGVTADALYCLRLPRLVCRAITGDDAAVGPVTTALLLLHIGTELLDDVTDGELDAAWVGRRPDLAAMAAAGYCAVLAPLALAQADVPPETAAALQGTFTRGLLAMFGGQATDIALTGSDAATVGSVEGAVAGKSGGALAMYAACGAVLAGASAEDVERWAEIGRCLGVAAQLRSECADIFGPEASRDLIAGKRTLPVAFYLEQLNQAERREALPLLDRARHDPEAREEARGRMRAADVLSACALLSKTYCQRARALLDSLAPLEPSRSVLEQLLNRQYLLTWATSTIAAV